MKITYDIIVNFYDKNVIFKTKYKGDIRYLLNFMKFSGYNDFMIAKKDDEQITWSYLDSEVLDPITFCYEITFYDYVGEDEISTPSLHKFKNLIEHYGFKVLNMEFLEQGKTKKK